MKKITHLLVAIVLLTTSVGIAKAERAFGDKFKSGKLWYKVTSTSPKEVEVVPKSDSWPHWQNDPEAPKGKINIPTEVQGYKVTAIGRNAFVNCKKLTSVEVHIPKIKFRAFAYCLGLQEIHLYDKVKTIDDQVFVNSYKLHTIKVSKRNSNFCSENGVLFSKDKTKLITYPTGKKAVAYEIPNSVKEIGRNAFSLSKLKYITIPKSVKKIGQNAFWRSISLKSIVSHVENVSSVVVEADAFKDVNKNSCKLRVPTGKENDYKNAQQWKDFNNVVRYRFEKGDRFKEGQLMYEITYVSPSSSSGLVQVVPQFPTYPYWDRHTEAIRPKGEIVIGDVRRKDGGDRTYVFKPNELAAGCFYGSEELKTIDMSYAFVKKIKENAFAECYGLEKVVLGHNITELGDYAFSECDGIKEINSKIKDINSVKMYDGLFQDDIYSTCKVTVPYGKVNDYKSAKHWKNFKYIKNGVNYRRHIVLWVELRKDIKLNLQADEEGTPVEISAGDNSYSLTVGKGWTGTKKYTSGNIATMLIFGNVNSVICSGNQGNVGRIEVENNTGLKHLNCSNNGLLKLDVSKNTKLEELICSQNSITSLDVSKNTKLEYLDCNSNKLSKLDLSKNTNLKNIDCNTNKLSKLDVSKNVNLKSIDCSNNQITSLDVSKNKELNDVYCYKNPFTTKAVDKLFCSLPNQTAKPTSSEIYVLNDANDANYAAVLASNKQNALDKKWLVLYADDDSSIPATTGNYICNPVAVTSVKVNPVAKTIKKDEIFTLTATVLPANATNKKVTWSSNKPAIATVDATGKVKGVAIGKAVITATTQEGNKKAQCVVTVKDNSNPVAVTSVKVNPTAKTIKKDEIFTLAATVLPANATNKKVTWSSNKPAIATVDATGKVKGIDIGKAVITATTQEGNKKAQCVVTVKDDTGLADVEEGGITIYPNPVKDVLHIDMVDSNDIQVEIYNTAGDKLVDVRNKNRISVSRLSSGVYFVKVITDKGVYSKKLIKK